MRRDFISALAVRRGDLRPLTAAERELHRQDVELTETWHRQGDRGPRPKARVNVVGDDVVAGDDHGVHEDQTWCGIPVADVAVIRSPFRPQRDFACAVCARRFLAHVEVHGLVWD